MHSVRRGDEPSGDEGDDGRRGSTHQAFPYPCLRRIAIAQASPPRLERLAERFERRMRRLSGSGSGRNDHSLRFFATSPSERDLEEMAATCACQHGCTEMSKSRRVKGYERERYGATLVE